MIKDGTQDEDSMVYFEFASGVQNQLYSMAYNDPITLSFSMKIELFGKVELQKLNTNGDLVVTRTMNEKGETEDITNLPLGKYIVKEETAPIGYIIE